MYYEINEEAARRAKAANSLSEYMPGSATAEYRAMVDEATARVESHKTRVDSMYHGKIDYLLDVYARKLAINMNQGFAIDARVPSVMIAGAGNFPVRKKEKQNAARDKNMEEWQHINGLLDKILSVGMGGISADDPNALKKLQSKLENEQKNHAHMKALNTYYRKHGTCVGFPGLEDGEAAWRDKAISQAHSWEGHPYPGYHLAYSRAEQKRLQERIASLQKLAENPSEGWEFKGSKVEVNTELNRVQIFFDEKPGEEKRGELKHNGFRWAPSQQAWQRQYTANGLRAAKAVTGCGNA